jgi:hypothetical protein
MKYSLGLYHCDLGLPDSNFLAFGLCSGAASRHVKRTKTSTIYVYIYIYIYIYIHIYTDKAD